MPSRSDIFRACNWYAQSNFISSWTDDLPVCKDSGIGLSVNSMYREDGHRQQEHECEDLSFHFKYDEKTSLYGVFDGHDGFHFARYALDMITAEILLGQLKDEISDNDIRQILKQAFYSVEKNYIDAIGAKLARKATLQMEMPDNVTPYVAYQQNPEAVNELNVINTELSCGCSAVVALIHCNRLYVANVGDSRALLCRTDQDQVLRVVQLSQDHNLSNEDEVLRLNCLGISKEKISKGFRLDNHEHTRCLGHYLVKGCYKEFEELACATSEPVIAEPEITGGIPLDNSHRFLMLMSSGLYKSLEDATGTRCVNKDIVQMVVEQFRTQSTLAGVSQTVVDKVVRIHHDTYMSRTGSDRAATNKREDITLLIRNFNFPLPNAISPSSAPAVSFGNVAAAAAAAAATSVTRAKENSDSCFTEDTTDSSSLQDSHKYVTISGKVRPYVDFTPYYGNVQIARREGRLPEDIEF